MRIAAHLHGRLELAQLGTVLGVHVACGNIVGSVGECCILTDRRNLVLAVNTADFPGNEIRMWYNPDLMENRQRAVFMAGCEVLDEKLVSFAYKE